MQKGLFSNLFAIDLIQPRVIKTQLDDLWRPPVQKGVQDGQRKDPFLNLFVPDDPVEPKIVLQSQDQPTLIWKLTQHIKKNCCCCCFKDRVERYYPREGQVPICQIMRREANNETCISQPKSLISTCPRPILPGSVYNNEDEYFVGMNKNTEVGQGEDLDLSSVPPYVPSFFSTTGPDDVSLTINEQQTETKDCKKVDEQVNSTHLSTGLNDISFTLNENKQEEPEDSGKGNELLEEKEEIKNPTDSWGFSSSQENSSKNNQKRISLKKDFEEFLKRKAQQRKEDRRIRQQRRSLQNKGANRYSWDDSSSSEDDSLKDKRTSRRIRRRKKLVKKKKTSLQAKERSKSSWDDTSCDEDKEVIRSNKEAKRPAVKASEKIRSDDLQTIVRWGFPAEDRGGADSWDSSSSDDEEQLLKKKDQSKNATDSWQSWSSEDNSPKKSQNIIDFKKRFEEFLQRKKAEELEKERQIQDKEVKRSIEVVGEKIPSVDLRTIMKDAFPAKDRVAADSWDSSSSDDNSSKNIQQKTSLPAKEWTKSLDDTNHDKDKEVIRSNKELNRPAVNAGLKIRSDLQTTVRWGFPAEDRGGADSWDSSSSDDEENEKKVEKGTDSWNSSTSEDNSPKNNQKTFDFKKAYEEFLQKKKAQELEEERQIQQEKEGIRSSNKEAEKSMDIDGSKIRSDDVIQTIVKKAEPATNRFDSWDSSSSDEKKNVEAPGKAGERPEKSHLTISSKRSTKKAINLTHFVDSWDSSASDELKTSPKKVINLTHFVGSLDSSSFDEKKNVEASSKVCERSEQSDLIISKDKIIGKTGDGGNVGDNIQTIDPKPSRNKAINLTHFVGSLDSSSSEEKKNVEAASKVCQRSGQSNLVISNSSKNNQKKALDLTHFVDEWDSSSSDDNKEKMGNIEDGGNVVHKIQTNDPKPSRNKAISLTHFVGSLGSSSSEEKKDVQTPGRVNQISKESNLVISPKTSKKKALSLTHYVDTWDSSSPDDQKTSLQDMKENKNSWDETSTDENKEKKGNVGDGGNVVHKIQTNDPKPSRNKAINLTHFVGSLDSSSSEEKKDVQTPGRVNQILKKSNFTISPKTSKKKALSLTHYVDTWDSSSADDHKTSLQDVKENKNSWDETSTDEKKDVGTTDNVGKGSQKSKFVRSDALHKDESRICHPIYPKKKVMKKNMEVMRNIKDGANVGRKIQTNDQQKTTLLSKEVKRSSRDDRSCDKNKKVIGNIGYGGKVDHKIQTNDKKDVGTTDKVEKVSEKSKFVRSKTPLQTKDQVKKSRKDSCVDFKTIMMDAFPAKDRGGADSWDSSSSDDKSDVGTSETPGKHSLKRSDVVENKPKPVNLKTQYLEFLKRKGLPFDGGWWDKKNSLSLEDNARPAMSKEVTDIKKEIIKDVKDIEYDTDYEAQLLIDEIDKAGEPPPKFQKCQRF